MLLDCFGIIKLLFWNPAARGRLVAEWRLMLREGGVEVWEGRRGGAWPEDEEEEKLCGSNRSSRFRASFLCSEVTLISHEVKTSTRQRENSVNQVRSSSRTRRVLQEKAAEGAQVASGSVRVCEEGPTGEPARKHSLFPKKFTAVRAQVTWVLARS